VLVLKRRKGSLDHKKLSNLETKVEKMKLPQDAAST